MSPDAEAQRRTQPVGAAEANTIEYSNRAYAVPESVPNSSHRSPRPSSRIDVSILFPLPAASEIDDLLAPTSSGRSLRAFGYLHQKVAISQRTVNESAAVAAALND